MKTPVKDISGVKGSELSVGKSVGVPAAAIVTAILLYAIFGEQPSSSVDDQ